ncbi:uncharacterized protein SEPMUDRAFT_165031 [Sphaerulina musiva SO2202]|uniref:Uncharacterized protein n=1 Tax=Sphaerulina musiva (strain SO2202) TaxID=692275 RepID=M3D340_SPHMS|nr:uncharacterized protein SEPMUDRAFT_165031 [Sphaerulina musiva SO2202]EMF11557.1 hypothetical protein SEPMUDRAFT_165031 [Sphaerulina musiva SO2202]
MRPTASTITTTATITASLPWTARAATRNTLTPQTRPQVQQRLQSPSTRSFSSTPSHQKKPTIHRDTRVTLIRYFLHHPLTPRPLRFSRTRFLRHWTIHRAWMRYQDSLRKKREWELERQYNSMARACEALRLIDGDGLTAEEKIKYGQTAAQPGGQGAEEDGTRSREGRLYRIAMLKDDIWKGVPIEYARIQTETPAKEGWNHGWTR